MIESHAEAGDLEKAAELLPEQERRFEQAVDALREMITNCTERLTNEGPDCRR